MSVAEDDLYRELECSSTATQAELRASYRSLVRRFHPDLFPNNPEIAARFQRITAAYDVLSDERKRRQYDLHGRVAIRAGFDPDRVQAVRAAEAAPLGPLPLAISFVESVRGGQKRIDMPEERQRRHGLPARLEVKVPPGLESGHVLHIAPRPPAREPLMLELTIAPHPLFRREGSDVVYELPVTVVEAIRGRVLTIPTPRGAVPFELPPGTASGAQFRVRGHGIAPHGNRPGGDLRFTVQVVLPRMPETPGARAVLDGFEALYDGPVRSGWFQTADLPVVGNENEPSEAFDTR